MYSWEDDTNSSYLFFLGILVVVREMPQDCVKHGPVFDQVRPSDLVGSRIVDLQSTFHWNPSVLEQQYSEKQNIEIEILHK